MEQITAASGEGRYRIEITAVLTGEGINVLLTGGEKPHVGAVVVCSPKDSGKDIWTAPIPGHRDAEAAGPVAELICSCTGQVTVVTAGIHIDKAEKWELEVLLKNVMEAAQGLVEQLKNCSCRI